jgi:hypothetical protein
MSPVGFEPATPASARPQTYALDPAVAGIGGTINDDRNGLTAVWPTDLEAS